MVLNRSLILNLVLIIVVTTVTAAMGSRQQHRDTVSLIVYLDLVEKSILKNSRHLLSSPEVQGEKAFMTDFILDKLRGVGDRVYEPLLCANLNNDSAARRNLSTLCPQIVKCHKNRLVVVD